jgi:ABC-2 type transport system ATP-binding protein
MNILEVKHVSKFYADHQALSDVSITVPQGSIYGLLGPNGAGKTSLIRIITQITRADIGEVLFDGKHLKPNDMYRIGYLPEERGLYKKMEVGEQLLYFAQLKGLSRQEALKRLRIWVEKFDIKSWWKKKVEELSKGMQQKIQFIATVLHEPRLIILDEPFSGFDPVNAAIITDEILKLKELGCSIIFSTHRMETVEQLCDHIALINQSKKILEGSVKEVREQFKTNIYEMEYIGNFLNLGPEIEIEEVKLYDNDHKLVVIRSEQNVSPNAILGKAINQVQVHRFNEKLPGMHDIFIRLVSESNNLKSLTNN